MKRNITVRVEAGTVRLHLPRATFDLSKLETTELRDTLNRMFPEQITDLMHDPRINDLDVLEAAKALLDERHQDTENLAYTIDHIKASLRPKGCTLCNCAATDERFGFPVCGYHADHTEDDDPCPKCVALWYWSDQNGNHWCNACVKHPDDTEGLERRVPNADDEWWCHECSALLPTRSDADTAAAARWMGQRSIKWVSEAWVNGRNATVATSEGSYLLEAYTLDKNGLPELHKSARFAFWTRALIVGERWTREGILDLSGAVVGAGGGS